MRLQPDPNVVYTTGLLTRVLGLFQQTYQTTPTRLNLGRSGARSQSVSWNAGILLGNLGIDTGHNLADRFQLC